MRFNTSLVRLRANFSKPSIFPLRLIPAVSTKFTLLPSISPISSTGSIVVPATSDTTERSCFKSAFKRELFPTFTRPIIPILMISLWLSTPSASKKSSKDSSLSAPSKSQVSESFFKSLTIESSNLPMPLLCETEIKNRFCVPNSANSHAFSCSFSLSILLTTKKTLGFFFWRE